MPSPVQQLLFFENRRRWLRTTSWTGPTHAFAGPCLYGLCFRAGPPQPRFSVIPTPPIGRARNEQVWFRDRRFRHGRSAILRCPTFLCCALPQRVELPLQPPLEICRCRRVKVAQLVGVFLQVVELALAGLVFDVEVLLRPQGLHPGPSP